MNVLLVDDDSFNITLMKLMLEKIKEAPISILTADNLATTIDLLKRENIDIVLLDLCLPDSEGMETVQRVINEAPSIPIVVMTGLNDTETASQALQYGAQDYLVKGEFGAKLLLRAMQYATVRAQATAALKRGFYLEEQLRQAHKMEAIGQLAAGVAHEINNPVGFVTSNTENLAKYFTSLKKIIDLYHSGARIEDIKELEKVLKIDFILKDIEGLISENKEGLARVAAIVRNLKDFARIDQKAQFAEVNINNSLQSALVLARNEIRYHADVHTYFGEIPLVYCNAGEINQVFLNILINAAQAIRDQQRQENGIIEVRTTTESDRVLCYLSDDGPGVPEKFFNQIFNPFFTTKDVGKGTGLGLSISYDIIVNKHGGKLSVARSTLGGAEFKIELPIKRAGENG